MRAGTRLRLVVAAMLGLAVTACVNLFGNACTQELGWEITPQSRTLAVGESLAPRGTIVTCGGRDREPAELVLVVADSSVVRVSLNAKSVEARSPGVASVLATDARYGPLGYITVTVVPR